MTFKIGGVELNVGTLMMACMAVIVGFQLVAFAFFTKVFAIAEGLLPEDPKLTRVFKIFTLEKGIVAGLARVAGGNDFVVARVVDLATGPLRPAAVHGGKPAPADSGGNAHDPWHPGRFFELLHERARLENRLAPAAGNRLRLKPQSSAISNGRQIKPAAAFGEKSGFGF